MIWAYAQIIKKLKYKPIGIYKYHHQLTNIKPYYHKMSAQIQTEVKKQIPFGLAFMNALKEQAPWIQVRKDKLESVTLALDALISKYIAETDRYNGLRNFIENKELNELISWLSPGEDFFLTSEGKDILKALVEKLNVPYADEGRMEIQHFATVTMVSKTPVVSYKFNYSFVPKVVAAPVVITPVFPVAVPLVMPTPIKPLTVPMAVLTAVPIVAVPVIIPSAIDSDDEDSDDEMTAEDAQAVMADQADAAAAIAAVAQMELESDSIITKPESVVSSAHITYVSVRADYDSRMKAKNAERRQLKARALKAFKAEFVEKIDFTFRKAVENTDQYFEQGIALLMFRMTDCYQEENLYQLLMQNSDEILGEMANRLNAIRDLYDPVIISVNISEMTASQRLNEGAGEFASPRFGIFANFCELPVPKSD
jgi:hypothetical protein